MPLEPFELDESDLHFRGNLAYQPLTDYLALFGFLDFADDVFGEIPFANLLVFQESMPLKSIPLREKDAFIALEFPLDDVEQFALVLIEIIGQLSARTLIRTLLVLREFDVNGFSGGIDRLGEPFRIRPVESQQTFARFVHIRESELVFRQFTCRSRRRLGGSRRTREVNSACKYDKTDD